MRKIIIIISVFLVLMLALGSTVAIAAPPEKVDVIIGFNRLPGQYEVGLIRSTDGNVKFTYNIIPAIAASVPETAIRGLSNNPRVTIIEPDVTIHAVDMELDNTWGV